MLKTQNLSFSYNHKVELRFPDLDLNQGDDLLILGESGVGKTTLLHLMAGLLKPKTGDIAFLDTILSQLSTKSLDRFRGKHMGLVFQKSHFIQTLSLKDNLALVQYLGGRSRGQREIMEVLGNLGIAHKSAERPSELSQGEQQRATMAMALINKPELILADEPTSSLDDKNCIKAIQLLKGQVEANNATLIIITHDHRLKDQFQNRISL